MLSALFTSVLHISLTTGMVIVVLLLLSSRINKRFAARWKYWIWLILGVRLLIPVAFSIPQAPVQITVPDRPVVETRVVPAPAQVAPQAQEPLEPSAPAKSAPPRSGWTVMELLARLWLGGVGLFLVYQGASYGWCKRQCLRWSRPSQQVEAREALAEACRNMGIAKPPELLISQKVNSPMVIGFFRPYLLLPQGEIAPRDLDFIFRHELVHLKRGDIWYKLILLLANALHWFNPAAALLFREAGKDLEIACDDQVVKGLSHGEKREYSEAILRSAGRQMGGTALTTHFYGGPKAMKERFANLLGRYKKRSGVLAGVAVLVCGAAIGSLTALNATERLDPEEYQELYQTYLQDLHVGMVASTTWSDANQVEADYFTYYYAASVLRTGGSFEGYDVSEDFDILIPAEELEAAVQRHFDVSTAHLRSARLYDAENNAYQFGGLGSAVDFFVTAAEKKRNRLVLDYDVFGGSGYLYAQGQLAVEIRGEEYKYRANFYEQSAEYHLAFPSSMDVAVENGVMTMDSGGLTSISDGENTWEYNGEDLASIIAYYEDQALPALEARGAADTGRYEDGWRWSGSYRDGVPLSIDVRHQYGGDSYEITATYGERQGEQAGGPTGTDAVNLEDWDELFVNYLGQPLYAGLLDTTWEIPFNIQDKGALVRFYAAKQHLYEGELRFPTQDVDAFLQRYFWEADADMIRQSVWYDRDTDTYFSEKGFSDGPAGMVTGAVQDSEVLTIAYQVFAPEGEEELLWEGELTVALSERGYQYVSNYMRYPPFPITQDQALLDQATETYVLPLMPAYGILFEAWASPEEIPADSLINFCAYNNLLGKPLLDGETAARGADLADQRGEAQEVEAAVQRYFAVSTQYLRSSQLYGYVDAENPGAYDGAYLLLNGFGGGGSTRALEVREDGELLHITVGLYGPDDEPDRPWKTSRLTLRLDGDGGFQYLSNVLE